MRNDIYRDSSTLAPRAALNQIFFLREEPNHYKVSKVHQVKCIAKWQITQGSICLTLWSFKTRKGPTSW
jgi:hypothetical protein